MPTLVAQHSIQVVGMLLVALFVIFVGTGGRPGVDEPSSVRHGHAGWSAHGVEATPAETVLTQGPPADAGPRSYNARPERKPQRWDPPRLVLKPRPLVGAPLYLATMPLRTLFIRRVAPSPSYVLSHHAPLLEQLTTVVLLS